MRVGIDIMGGDYYPQAPVGGVILAKSVLKKEVELVLIGQEDVIKTELQKQGANPADFVIQHSPEIIAMDEHPAKSITTKQNSSINIGIGMVKKGNLDAFLSAGNTGAMLVGSVLGLGTIEGVLRPTIGSWFPSRDKFSLLCDVGANIEVKPEQLYQFGVLGSTYIRLMLGIENPRVALMNLGEEKTKGTPVVQQAYALFEQNKHKINFVGNAEGRHINDFKADVYVTDGFTGNILLKFGESLYNLFKPKLPNDPDIDLYNFEHFGGVPILGVNGNIMIGHGICGAKAFEKMICEMVKIVKLGLKEEIKRVLSEK